MPDIYISQHHGYFSYAVEMVFFFLPIENIAYTVCTVAWFSLHWLLMHDLLNHISDLVPYIVSTISLETDDLSTSCWNLPYHSFPGAADVLSVALSTVE